MTRVVTNLKSIIGIQCKRQQRNGLTKTFSQSYHSYQSRESNARQLTSQEVAKALRPFFFVVHPDRFWKYPKEKDTNEDSLKQLNAHIEDVIEMKETSDRRITFFMREETKKKDNRCSDTNAGLKQITLNLLRRENINKIVHKILSECKLSTDYLEKIGKQPKEEEREDRKASGIAFGFNSTSNSGFTAKKPNEFWVNRNAENETEFHEFVEYVEKKKIEKNLMEWLRENTDLASNRLEKSEPIRQELNRLTEQLKQELSLTDVLWKDCGWGASHIRGAVKSLNTLKQQHNKDFDVLSGRTLIFGRQSGVTFDGHVILNIEDVRHNWLEMIRNIRSYDSDLHKLPFFENALSATLRGITIDHRKFRPALLVKNYSKQLEKLTAALVEHIAKKGYPRDWPQSLDMYQLVVECEAGPLMLSPTGQFIVPASCPGFLLFDFISENMFKSRLLRDMYLNYKLKEVRIIDECLTAMGLQSIEKDDNVTPDLMIECCENLVLNKEGITRFLRGNRLRVSHYYSVLSDGEICIPWNFRI